MEEGEGVQYKGSTKVKLGMKGKEQACDGLGCLVAMQD